MLARLGLDLNNPRATWVFTTRADGDGRRSLDVVRVGASVDETQAFYLASRRGW